MNNIIELNSLEISNVTGGHGEHCGCHNCLMTKSFLAIGMASLALILPWISNKISTMSLHNRRLLIIVAGMGTIAAGIGAFMYLKNHDLQSPKLN